jgi:hypothetical protein
MSKQLNILVMLNLMYKRRICTQSNAQEVVALSQVATYVRSPHQVFSTIDGLLLHRHMHI